MILEFLVNYVLIQGKWGFDSRIPLQAKQRSKFAFLSFQHSILYLPRYNELGKVSMHWRYFLEVFLSIFILSRLSFLNSLVGADSFDLIDDAVQTAVHYNALGVLVTDWSGYGHVTPFEVSFPALATGGTLAWNSKMKQVCSVIFLVFTLYVSWLKLL